jgi:hypothetical protein
MAGTVTVACSWPNGFLLRVGEWETHYEPVLGGGMREAKTWTPRGEPIKINGPARAFGEDYKAPVQNGFALTHGVDEDFMKKWMEDNADHPAVQNGLIKIHANARELNAMTREGRDLKTGAEPLQPDDDPRIPKRTARAIKKAER